MRVLRTCIDIEVSVDLVTKTGLGEHAFDSSPDEFGGTLCKDLLGRGETMLASEMNMSRSNLHLRVKALFGVPALEFIKTIRLNEACRLLHEKKYSIAEIAYMTGFATPSYFASAFRRSMGVTPTEYIRKQS